MEGSGPDYQRLMVITGTKVGYLDLVDGEKSSVQGCGRVTEGKGFKIHFEPVGLVCILGPVDQGHL